MKLPTIAEFFRSWMFPQLTAMGQRLEQDALGIAYIFDRRSDMPTCCIDGCEVTGGLMWTTTVDFYTMALCPTHEEELRGRAIYTPPPSFSFACGMDFIADRMDCPPNFENGPAPLGTDY